LYFYEKWDVYNALLELRRVAAYASRKRIPGYDSDQKQFTRAASSGVLNLAEGAREQQIGRKLERYRTTLSSTSECNAALTILSAALPNDPMIARGRDLCTRISSMMTNLIRNVESRLYPNVEP
jgi:four helix bundle protein